MEYETDLDGTVGETETRKTSPAFTQKTVAP